MTSCTKIRIGSSRRQHSRRARQVFPKSGNGGRQVRKLQVPGLVFACFGRRELWCFLAVSWMFLAPRNSIWYFRKGEILGKQAGNRNIVPKRCISHLFPTCFRRISLSWTPLKFPVSRYFKFPACFLVVSHCFPSPETTQHQPRNLKFPHKFPRCFPALKTPALLVVTGLASTLQEMGRALT